MKKIICIVLLITLLFSLCACKENTCGHSLCACNEDPGIYDCDWIIGKTSLEVEEKYGEFYHLGYRRPSDGLFCSTECHYLLREKTDIFGYTDIVLFSIRFDENGVATECLTQLGPIGG